MTRTAVTQARAVLGLALAAIAAPSLAGAMSDAELASIVAQRLHGDRTGACVAVAVIDTSVSRAYGCADDKDRARIGPTTAFEIGSVSKTMTSALLAELIEQGDASLDDPLSAYLPEGTAVPTFNAQPILLRHIVTHTSGLPALPPGAPLGGFDDPYAKLDPAELLAALGRTTLQRAPGSQFEYSNFASMLLSYAVARRTGSDFETLLQARLFAPLQMRNAYVNRRPDGVRAAVGHAPNAQPVPAWNFQGDLAGVGGVRATLDDMVAYMQGQLGHAPAPLQAAIARSQQPVNPGGQPAMAMNWMLAPLNGRTVHAHEGGTGGFSSFVAFDREGGRGVVVLADTAMHTLGGLASLGLPLLDSRVPLGKPRHAKAADAALLDALVGDYALDGGLTMHLSRKGQALVIQAQGQPAFEMGHDDAGDFYPLLFDASLTPQRRADGSYGFLWQQAGSAMSARRLDAAPVPALSTDALRAYAGEYPLMPSFALTVSERDGKLFGQATGQGAFELTPAAKDVFEAAAFGIEVRFERGDDDRVTALQLLQGGNTLRGERR